MADAIEMPPALQDAVPRLKKFLQEHGWPEEVAFVGEEELIWAGDYFWVRLRKAAHENARESYDNARRRGLGVALNAVCTDSVSTYAHIYIPQDDRDRQEHMLAVNCLKLSVPLRRSHARSVRNPALWAALCLLHRRSHGYVTNFLR